MQRRISGIYIIVALGLLGLTAAGCAGPAEDQAVTITAATVSKQSLEMPLEFSGALVPVQTVSISSKTAGQVVQLGFGVGSKVNKGDILIQLDTEQLEGQILQAKAGLQSARAAAESAENQAVIAKINLDKAQKYYDRISLLSASGAVSQSDLDNAQDALDIAARQYENVSGAALEQAQAAVDTANANLMGLNVQLKNTTIKSPLSGTITSQNVNIGEIVSPGVQLVSIIDTSTLKLRSTIAQDLLPLLTQGQEVDVTIDSYPDKILTGKVTSIGPIAVSTGQVFPVEITMMNDIGLMAGLSAHASLSAEVEGLIVPSSSVMNSNGESYVFVIKDQIASRQLVKVGLKNNKQAQILEGLDQGEQIAVSNVKALADKMPVNIEN